MRIQGGIQPPSEPDAAGQRRLAEVAQGRGRSQRGAQGEEEEGSAERGVAQAPKPRAALGGNPRPRAEVSDLAEPISYDHLARKPESKRRSTPRRSSCGCRRPLAAARPPEHAPVRCPTRISRGAPRPSSQQVHWLQLSACLKRWKPAPIDEMSSEMSRAVISLQLSGLQKRW